MMVKEKIKFNVEILIWGIKESGLTLDKIAKKLGTKKEKVEKWLKKEDFPTYKQLRKLSDILNIPFGYFFLKKLPVREKLEIPDFRHAKDSIPLTKNFYEIYYDVKRKHDWIKLKREKEEFNPLEFVEKYTIDDNPKEIAEDIKNILSITEKELEKPPNELLLNIIEKAEKCGIIVIKNSILINNSHIKLDPNEFRGFVIVDKLAPVIFINGADSIKAQIFTLFHELAHIWLGQSGISDVNLENTNYIERLCNQVAVEILMPEEKIRKLWNSSLEPYENIKILSKTLPVSKLALSYRGVNLGLITFNTQKEIEKILKEEWLAEKGEEKRGTGGDYYRTIPIRNSKTLTREVLSSLQAGELLYKEAAQLLNVKVKSLKKMLENLRGLEVAE